MTNNYPPALFRLSGNFDPSVYGATAWYDAKDLTTAMETLPNRITPTADPAIRGSADDDTLNNPTFLAHNGSNYVYFPEVALNGVYSDAFATPVGDFTVIWDGVLDDLTGATTRGLVCQYCTGTNLRAWSLALSASGLITVYLSIDGTANVTTNSTINISTAVAAGQRFQLKAVFDFDAGGATVTYTVSTDDGVTFNAFEAVSVPTVTATQIYQASVPMNIGARYATGATGTGATEVLGGIVYSVTIEGVEQFAPGDDIDTSADPDAGQTGWTGGSRTWTVQRATSGLTTAVVTRPVMLFDGTDDYLQLPASDTPGFSKAAGEFAAIVAYRKHYTTTSADRILSFESAADDGVYLAFDANDDVGTYYGDGTAVSSIQATDVVDGDLSIAAMSIPATTVAAYTSAGGLSTPTAKSGVTTEAAFGAGRVASQGFAVSALPGGLEVFAVVVFASNNPTTAQLQNVQQRLLSGTYL